MNSAKRIIEIVGDIFDRAGHWWIERRTDQAVKAGGYDKLGLHRAGFSQDGQRNHFEVTMVDQGEAIFALAQQAAALLSLNQSRNFLEVTMMPRLTREHPFRPIVLTIRWQDGKTPATLLREMRRALRSANDALQAAALVLELGGMFDTHREVCDVCSQKDWGDNPYFDHGDCSKWTRLLNDEAEARDRYRELTAAAQTEIAPLLDVPAHYFAENGVPNDAE